MLKKRVLAFAVASALVACSAIIPATAGTIQEGSTSVAKNGDFVQLKNGDTLKVFNSFENSDVGHLIGTNKDPLYMCDSNGANSKVQISIQALGENGSHALVFATKDNFDSTSSAYCQPEYEGSNEANVVNNFEGANAFGFWVDTTDCADGAGPVTAQFLFGEQDCDTNGNLELDIKNQPAGSEYHISAASATYYIQNPDGSWKEMTNSKSNWLDIPIDYQGYIKIPFDSYELTWGQDDDNQIDMKNVMSVMFAYGIWPKNIDHTGLVIDNIGFFGNYPDATTTTETPTTTTTTAAPTTVAPTTASTLESTAAPTAATTAASTEGSTAATTAAPTTAAPTTAAPTTAAPTTAARTTAAPTAATTSLTTAQQNATVAPADTTAPETTGTSAENPKTGSGNALPAIIFTALAASTIVISKKKLHR